MRLKMFYAKTMTEAMHMVRKTLGEDAVIVSTRDEKGGGVSLTAAIDPSDYTSPNFEVGRERAPAKADDWLQYDEEDEDSAVAEDITDAMLRHGVPEDVMDQVLSCATVIGLENPGIALIAAIEHLYSFKPVPRNAYKKAFMIVGPPGAGKTLVAAKMAARATMDGLRAGVITTDTVRAGGVEQLQAFTKLLQIELHKADHPQDVSHAMQKLRACDQIIIDTPGLNPFASEDIKQLARMLDTDRILPVLALPAGMDAEESGDMAEAFSAIGVERFIPTRVDIARRLGGLLSAAHHGNLSFAEVSKTPKVANGLTPLDPKSLSRMIMPQAFSDHGTSRDTRTRTKTRTGTRS